MKITAETEKRFKIKVCAKKQRHFKKIDKDEQSRGRERKRERERERE
jgi:hypothetical protein